MSRYVIDNKSTDNVGCCSIFQPTLGKKAINYNRNSSLYPRQSKIKLVSLERFPPNRTTSKDKSINNVDNYCMTNNYLKIPSRVIQPIIISKLKKTQTHFTFGDKNGCSNSSSADTPKFINLSNAQSLQSRLKTNSFLRNTMIITSPRKTISKSFNNQSPRLILSPSSKNLQLHESEMITVNTLGKQSSVLPVNSFEDLIHIQWNSGSQKLQKQDSRFDGRQVNLDDIREVVTQFDGSESASFRDRDKSQHSEIVSNDQHFLKLLKFGFTETAEI